MGIVRDIAPLATSFAFLVNPNNPNAEPDSDFTRRSKQPCLLDHVVGKREQPVRHGKTKRLHATATVVHSIGLNSGRRYDVRPFLRFGTPEFSKVLRRADFWFCVKLGEGCLDLR